MESIQEKVNSKIRKIDDLGRIQIPLKERKKFNIKTGDKFDIYISDKSIFFRKFDVEIQKNIVQEYNLIFNKEQEITVQIKNIKYKTNGTGVELKNLKSIDELGRIIIPKNIRDALKLEKRDNVKFDIKDDMIVLNREYNKKQIATTE